MEKVKISAYQLFVLILSFQLGSAILVPIAAEAGRDAWLALLIAMCGGIGLFLVHYRLYRFFPELVPAEYMQKLLGKIVGKLVAFLYVLLFVYLAARVLRSFGEMLVTAAYVQTPLTVVNALLIVVIIYALHKGIEVLARTGELFFITLYLLAVVGFILIIASGLIEIQELKPVLEEGIGRVFRVVVTETLYVPFGEIAVFSTLLPYLKEAKKAKRAGIIALVLTGINLALVMAINISVLGLDTTKRSQFPLLTTIQSIQLADFIERLDVFFMFTIVIGIFFKISVFLYAAVMGTSIIFKIKNASQLVYPFGIITLFISITTASSYPEHLKEGLQVTTQFLHPLFLVVIPILLLALAYWKNRNKKGK
ncbi:GerAB/ArcD/ProY family transporter [Bacillus sp. B15-48]|uniref:GerAB/ArcD/ProY family transporter n=1 Tax=Bacillus sp. B15-48 TaxID=1548601 RepID=UPI00193FDBF8|nr:GerAB/ArcD/ProY family transporter [Bacillus sp. B15-48]MBM4760978.1 GerAB/ArcD/ProY family transporter [Bacillus sp. B15-48]